MSILQQVLLVLIKLYQKTTDALGPLYPKVCRFYPSCSCYMHRAILHHGPFKGVQLGINRILKCHPFHPGGVDPVPGLPAQSSP